MPARLIRCTVMTLVLALTPLLADAQRNRRNTDQPPPSNASSCTAAGLRCLFGRAEGCSVTCVDSSPVCEGARCILGIPLAAQCRCE